MGTIFVDPDACFRFVGWVSFELITNGGTFEGEGSSESRAITRDQVCSETMKGVALIVEHNFGSVVAIRHALMRWQRYMGRP